MVEEAIIREARIVCTTLSMSGIDKLEIMKGEFDYLIVDEACQTTEPSCLIPFALEPLRVILVGDQKQLPATTISENSELTRFARSFFERLLDNGYERHLLTVQYRMHEQIRKFPSDQFYEGRITDDDSVKRREMPLMVVKMSKRLRNRVTFIDLPCSSESLEETSKINNQEAKAILGLL